MTTSDPAGPASSAAGTAQPTARFQATETGRVEGFSDSILVIALTILALGMTSPEHEASKVSTPVARVSGVSDLVRLHRSDLAEASPLMSYTLAGALGYFLTPIIALVIFLALPVFYFLTSEGLPRPRASRS